MGGQGLLLRRLGENSAGSIEELSEMKTPMDRLILLLEGIVNRLEAKPNRTAEETLLLVDAKTRLAVAKDIKE